MFRLAHAASNGEASSDNAPAAAEPVTILALGDSLTAGYGLGPGQAYPELLAEMLEQSGRHVRMINAGVSGDTSAGGLSRVDWLLSDKPEVAILALGANDALRGLSPVRLRENLARIIEKLQGAGARVLLVGMYAPPNLGAAYGEAFNPVYPELAEQYETSYYPFILEGVATDPRLNQGDGIHPNAEGARLIAEHLFPQVAELVDQAGAKSP